ncbi:MAG: metallophosphoesterase [Candidatus Eiseniibacteriota bacterium]
MTDLNILPPYPALLMQATVDGRKRSMIVVSDLHIGLAPWFQANNVSIDWYQVVQEIERDLERIVTSNNADSIVLLGDIKNTISTIERDDWKIIPKFFESLSKKCEVYFIPGNHDSKIRFLLPNRIFNIGVTGMTVDDTLLIHGHTMPSDFRSNVNKIIMGHNHPIFLKDESIATGQKVWIFLRVNKSSVFPRTEGLLDLILVPSYGKSFVKPKARNRERFNSPILRRIMKPNVITKCLIFSVDGSILGNEDILWTSL